jgi:Domain of unknown function (DUF1906)
MPIEIVDYSYSKPGAQAIINYGAIGAMRYLGNDSRCIFAAERDELLNAGLGIGLIWETKADRTLDGYNAGRDDAHLANNYANNLGAPGWVPIYYATDFHAQGNQITGPICDYYRAARDYGGREVRCYGGAPVLDHLHDHLGLRGAWQPAAASWSDYRMSPYAVMHQQVAYVINNTSDTNFVLCGDDDIDWLWGYEGGIPVTEDELRKIVQQECSNAINAALSKMYTGSRAVCVDGEEGIYEIGWANGQRVRRHIPTPEQIQLFQYVDQIAGAVGDQPRKITDPNQVAAFLALPIVEAGAPYASTPPPGGSGGGGGTYVEILEPEPAEDKDCK